MLTMAIEIFSNIVSFSLQIHKMNLDTNVYIYNKLRFPSKE